MATVARMPAASGAAVSVPEPGPSTAAALNAWRLGLRAHAEITRVLEADLLAAHDLPLSHYDVLVQLAEAPGSQLRMSELAERVLLSRSGLTRLVDRLVRDGLVSREACPDDARGMLAVLTPAGRDRLREASPVHLRGIQHRVFDRLTPTELAQLSRIFVKLVDGSAPPSQAEAVGE
jgi:DNA-binding MarR family transcriptional regulator